MAKQLSPAGATGNQHTDPASSPSLNADTHPAEATAQTVPSSEIKKGPATVGQVVTLKRYIGKDGVKFAQDEIYLDLAGKATRFGYVGHPPHVGIAFIRSVTNGQRIAVEAAVEQRFGQKADKIVHAPGVGDLTGDQFQDDLEDEFSYGGETE